MVQYLLDLLCDILVYAGILLLVVYIYCSSCYNYWKNRNFPYLSPAFPLGNNRTFFCKYPGPTFESFDHYREIRRKGYKFAGLYSITRPILIVTDPEIVKDILVKDFDYFTDRGFYKTRSDPLSISVFSMDSVEWRKTRMKLTPTFTSGKVKMMFPIIMSMSEKIVNEMNDSAITKADINIKQMAVKFTIDSLASCALGIEPGTTGNMDIFSEITRKQFDPQSFMRLLRFSLLNRFPEFSERLGLNIMTREISDFFKKVLKESIEYRKINNYHRPDLLESLINLQKKTNDGASPLSDDQLAAEVLNLFLASVDTSPSTISFTLFELARNPEIQKKVRDEIDEVLMKHDDKLNADCLTEMKYLRQVMNETLRLYPPLPTLERRCVKNYKITETNSMVEKGTKIIISVYGIHRDSDYYSDPDEFDPDRFSEDNKENIKSHTYFPFGIGPRNCIGLRFGWVLVQVAVIEILKRFRLSVSSSTQLPLEMDRQALTLTLKSPIFLKAEKI